MSDQNPKPSLFGNIGGGGSSGASSGNPFSFGGSTGTPPTSTGGSNLFGAGNATSGSNLFGSAAKPPADSNKPATSLFGNVQTPSKPTTTGPEALSTPANNSSAPGNHSTTPMFSPPAPGASLFGQKPGAGAQPGSNAAAPTSLFGAPSSNTPKSTTGLFGQPSSNSSGGSNIFGQNNSKPPAATQDKEKGSTSLFGAPPAAPAGDQSQKSSPFGAPATTSAGDQSQKPSLFGSAAVTTSASTPSFGSNAPSKPLFGAPASSSSTTPPQAATTSTTSPNIFGGLPLSSQQKSGGASTAQKSDAAPSGGQTSTSAPSAAPTSLFGAPAPTSQASASQAPAAPSASLFGGFGKPAASTATSQPAPSPLAMPTLQTTSAAQDSAKTTTGDSAAPTSAASQPTSAAPATGATANNAASFGTSTAGPAPTPQSRLKNKTMDDIITRWATDLKKYQKEFQVQAEKVAQWDRLLVENSNAITKLYSRTFQAERDTAEVQKQLSAVEDNQAELSQWLDRYEQEVESLMAKEGMGQREGLQGPDQERERTYKAAERVQEKLSDMGNELTGLIEEINSVSNTLSNSSKPDDPLSQIVRILNNHLSQLQQIDQDTSALQAKVAAAKAESQRLGYRGNVLDSASDDFYRSFRSVR